MKLFLGHAAYAQTLVLAIFMGGMAIGSWACSRYSTKWKNLLLGYALTEGIIGFCAFIFHGLFTRSIDISYIQIIPQIGTPAFINVFKWGLSALMILPQSVLLGMTFPLMSSGILRLFPNRPGKTIAMLYFANSIGAAVGVLVSGFILIRVVGLPWTMGIAGFINISLAIIVWTLICKMPSVECRDKEEILVESSLNQNTKLYNFFLVASFVTGAASFIYEIGWIRMLSLVLGTSTHAFELMLSAFILGLAFGGLWIQRCIDKVVNPVMYLSKVQVVMGLLALSTLLFYGNTFEVMQWIVKTIPKSDNGYLLFNLSSSVIAMAIMLPTTFCAGMTLPLITYVLIKQGCGEKSIGAVYATNTIGAITGVFFAIHLGLPLLGLKGLITCGAGLDIVLGIALFWSIAKELKNYRQPAVVSVLGISAIAATLLFVHLNDLNMASGVYRFGQLLSKADHKIIYHKDGKTATVSMLSSGDGSFALTTNGKADASIMMYKGLEATPDETTMILTAVIPMSLNPQIKTAACIGLGSGLTSQTLLYNPGIIQLDTVEIERGIIDASKHFRPRVELVYTDPRSKIFVDDAKTFFSTYNKKYDLIVSEPSNPWVSGIAGLFSEEFYHIIKNYMNKDGLFVQWIQLYEINTDLIATVLKAVSANFSDFAIYLTDDQNMIIVSKKNGALPEIDSSIFKIPAISSVLQRVHVNGVQDIAIRKIGTKKVLAKMLGTYPNRPNSDYYPILDQNAARTRFLGLTAKDFTSTSHMWLPVLEMLDGQNLKWGNTNVSKSPYLLESKSAVTAMAIRDFFLKGSFDPKYGEIPDDFVRQAKLVKELFNNCIDEQNQYIYAGSLFVTSIAMIPYLTQNELDSIWKSLEKGTCTASISPSINKLVHLFKAIGKRDSLAMVTTAKKLLESGNSMTPSAMKYVLASAMLGSVSRGDYATSSQFWTKYNKQIYGNAEPDVLFRLLNTQCATNDL
ncbi:hypothetical protein KOM00_18230 [Geomonas sp. Red69]|uniref:spermine/spermidine synthase domain-containing protein n=1 Tax=Geomonas diazotrophica TaxID=2843197 RepID=UPI001C123347|nr:hypothetical protein [Geomonas diazotrophica]MBU5638669.1 hypothetical protein [Geomonas diazotrophica]